MGVCMYSYIKGIIQEATEMHHKFTISTDHAVSSQTAFLTIFSYYYNPTLYNCMCVCVCVCVCACVCVCVCVRVCTCVCMCDNNS